MAKRASERIPYRASPVGALVYPWVNKPDTKFNKDGQWKTGLRLEGQDAAAFKEVIDAAVDAAFDAELDELPAKDRPRYSKYYPYTEELDDAGAKTGAIVFNFKQNAVITVEGERKEIPMRLFDSSDKEVHTAVFGGTIGRVMWKPRTVKIDMAKQIGVSLAFVKVQIIKLADRNTSGGFGSVEDGYVEEEAASGCFEGAASGGSVQPGDDF